MPVRSAKPDLSASAQRAYEEYEYHLKTELDLRSATVRNYLSDVQQFMAWFEKQHDQSFALDAVATPTLTTYRDYLQHDLQRKPATINRYLVSLKRYFSWASQTEKIQRNPAKPVKLVNETTTAPEQISDVQETKLMAAVERENNLRDITLITLMLHTGLRVSEVCNLKWEHVALQPRSGYLKIWGKRQKYREVPLNSTARKTLSELQLEIAPEASDVVFVSVRTKGKLTTRAIGFIIKKYAKRAGLDIHPHDLRHRFGYRMAKSTPLHRLAQIMGHDSLDTTMIYVQATQHDLQQEVEDIAWE
jgi:integrase/recombinase XerC